MNISTEQLEKAVIEQATRTLVEEFTGYDNQVAEKIRSAVQELIENRVNQEIETQVRAIVNGGLEKIVFPQTNRYGEKAKPDQTLREFIGSTTQAVFTEYLDNDGKPTKDSWYQKPENQRVNRIIKKAIEDRIGAQVIEAAQSLQTQIHTALGTYVKVALDDAMAKLRR